MKPNKFTPRRLKLASTANPDGSALKHSRHGFDPRQKAAFDGERYNVAPEVKKKRVKKDSPVIKLERRRAQG